jgi:hypothetical protein
MADSSIPNLSKEHYAEISAALCAHRPLSRFTISAGNGHANIAALSTGGGRKLGEWDLVIMRATAFLRVIVGETEYQETIVDPLPIQFNRVLNGLRDWGKALNALELKELLDRYHNLNYLNAEHIMDPADYRPLGGALS